jgi:FkbM family methyltransferase
MESEVQILQSSVTGLTFSSRRTVAMVHKDLQGLSIRTPRPPGFNVHLDTVNLTGVEPFHLGQELKTRGLGGYEPEVFAAINAYLETSLGSAHFVDIGANIGIFSLMAKATFGDGVFVHCFEPLPALASLCRDLAGCNGLDLIVGEYALAEVDGRAAFYVSASADTSNSLNASFRRHKAVIEVKTARLDTLFDTTTRGNYVVKIDTESTEPNVLDGGMEFLEFARPAIVCEVLANRTEARLQEVFAQLDYIPIHLRDRPNWDGDEAVVGDETYQYRDWLFVPEPPAPATRSRFYEWFDAYRSTAR